MGKFETEQKKCREIKKKVDKKKQLREKHSKRQARERYNLNRVDENRIISKIIQGDCTYVRTDLKSGAEIYYVKYGNTPVKVLYSPVYRNIITQYPFDVEEYNALISTDNDGDNEMAKDYVIQEWCDIAGYEAFCIDKDIYLKRPDVFLGNTNVINNLVTKKLLLKGLDFITLLRQDYPECPELFKNGAPTISLIKLNSLEKLLSYITDEEICENIEKILYDSQMPMSPEKEAITHDALLSIHENNYIDEALAIGEEITQVLSPIVNASLRIEDDEVVQVMLDGEDVSVQEMLERVKQNPSQVKMIPMLKETTIIELLEQSKKTIEYAITELKEKDIQIEKQVEKFDALQKDWNLLYTENQELKKTAEENSTLIGKIKGLFK